MSIRTTDTSSKGFGPRKVYRGKSLPFYSSVRSSGIIPAPSPYQFNFESFPNGSNEPDLTFVWSANGEPTHVNNHIYLTEITGSKSPGNVWYNTILSYNRDWELYVNFECSGGSGADGWCVQWHTSNNQLGVGGGDCGRIDDGSNVPYVFSFETYTTDGIETYINSVSQGRTSVTNEQFRQNLYYWLVYNHAASTVDIFYSTTNTKPGTPQHTYSSRSFSSTQYYIGIGAAFGGANDNHILKAMSLEFT